MKFWTSTPIFNHLRALKALETDLADFLVRCLLLSDCASGQFHRELKLPPCCGRLVSGGDDGALGRDL